MEQGQTQTQRMEQRLVLTQSMRQSLKVLQMPLPELREYLLDEALSNPLLDVQDGYDLALPTPGEETELLARREAESGGDETPIICSRERADHSIDWNGGGVFPMENLTDRREENFTEILLEQLRQMNGLDGAQEKLCEYLVQCLSENGYLEFDLQEIARELSVCIFEVEQALYVVQSLQPTGVGARSLVECLILQLVQSRDFNAHTIHLVREGLTLLARDDLEGIAGLLNCSAEQAEQAMNAVRRLRPIPSRGYGNGKAIEYQIPEATIITEGGSLTIELNRKFLPQLCYDTEISDLLKNSGGTEELAYLKEQSGQARQLIQCVKNRQSTVERLLDAIVRYQAGYFLSGEPLRPMTMSQLAEELGLNISTVSRALQGKSVVCRGRNYPLRELFTSAIVTPQGTQIFSSSVKRQIQQFVQAEDPTHPLSDEELKTALEAVQLSVSRRTVAKYREELGIPSSNARRRGCQKREPLRGDTERT